MSGAKRVGLFLTVLCAAATAQKTVSPPAPVRVYGLAYPRLAAQAGTAGTVILRCTISPGGAVAAVQVVSGPPILADAASANAARWRFRPAPAPADSTVTLTYRFELRDTASSAEPAEFRYDVPDVVVVSAVRPRFLPSSAGVPAKPGKSR